MNKVYVYNSIITTDHQSKQNYILSSSNDNIVFPRFEIESSRFLHNEIKCKIKNLFKTNTIRFIEEIIISFIDIQNELLIKYIDTSGLKSDHDDIFLLSSIILSSKIDSHLYWKNFNYEINFQSEDIVTTLIDYCLQKSLI